MKIQCLFDYIVIHKVSSEPDLDMEPLIYDMRPEPVVDESDDDDGPENEDIEVGKFF